MKRRRSILIAFSLAAGLTCAAALAEQSDRVDFLIQKLQEGSGLKVRLQAAMLLGSVGDKRAISPLVEATQDPAFAIRGAAVIALGKIGDPKAIPALFEVSKDRDKFVREQAVRALRQIVEKEKAVPLVLRYLKNADDERIRAMAIDILGGIKSTVAMNAVIEALGDPDDEVSDAAAQAIMNRGNEKAGAILLQAMYSRTPGVRLKAIRLFRRLKDPRAVQPLASILTSDIPGPEQAEAAAVLKSMKDRIKIGPLLSALANSQDKNTRDRAIVLLGIKGGEEAITSLTGVLLSEPEDALRGRAVKVLAELGDPRAVEPIEKMLRDRSNARLRPLITSSLKILKAKTKQAEKKPKK